MLELLKLIPRYEFEALKKRYNGNHYTKHFTGWQPLITFLFSQGRSKGILGEIETSLSMHYTKWYQIGLQGIRRSTLSDTMNKKPILCASIGNVLTRQSFPSTI
ncbi:DUF4372 domain-containing protein [Caldithrix abyssi]|nr:DUF4372 domain-containing protein [Caldithrix abyssi]